MSPNRYEAILYCTSEGHCGNIGSSVMQLLENIEAKTGCSPREAYAAAINDGLIIFGGGRLTILGTGFKMVDQHAVLTAKGLIPSVRPLP